MDRFIHSDDEVEEVVVALRPLIVRFYGLASAVELLTVRSIVAIGVRTIELSYDFVVQRSAC